MSFMEWLRRLLGQKEAPPVAPVPPAAPPAPSPPTTTPPAAPVPVGPPPPGLDLSAADFLPIANEELKESAKDVRRGGAWFGRRDLIPPASDLRTKLIDRAMVVHGLLTPEQLAEIHRVGVEMERLRPSLVGSEALRGPSR